MRLRLEKEQGAGHPLKAGLGGFYDIDFSLLYLRLKAAGIFYKVLNTPARIDIIEAMGHLERADAEFLRDAATFYRAMDHGLRVYSGHAEANLPNSETQLEVLDGVGASLDAGPSQLSAVESGVVENPKSHARDFRPLVYVVKRSLTVALASTPGLFLSRPETAWPAPRKRCNSRP